MKCRYCSEEFKEKAVNQRYCSALCGERYRRANPDELSFPPIAFRCAKCGKAVVTDGIKDKRTRFCSETCERRYWRHPPKPSSISNYQGSLLEWYEKNSE